MWAQRFIISHDVADEWTRIVRPGEWRIGPASDLQEPFPSALAAKCDSVFTLASGLTEHSVVYMANANRVDGRLVDQMPFGFVLYEDGPTDAVLLHHGTWSGRTSSGLSVPHPGLELSEEHRRAFGDVFSGLELPDQVSGSTERIIPASQLLALDAIAREIRGQTPFR